LGWVWKCEQKETATKTNILFATAVHAAGTLLLTKWEIAIQPFWLWVTAQLGHEQVNETKI